MTQPKLRDGAEMAKLNAAREFATDSWPSNANDAGLIDVMRDRGNTYNDFCCGVDWALANLHKLLEPREQPLVNGKRVAIVEVEE